jgi:hypothetical protein
MTSIVARAYRNTVEYKEWEDYFFRVESESPENFCGMIFGLLYWAATDDETRGRALAALAALCAVGINKWLNRVSFEEEPRIIYSNIPSDEEAGVLSFLESVESLDSNGITLDCDTLIAALLDRRLVNVDEKSLAIKLGIEYIDSQDLEKLKQYCEKIGVSFISLVRRGSKKFKESRLDEISDEDAEDDI